MNIKSLHLIGALALLPGLVSAFDSGSTGADGDFNPAQKTELQLPPDGIFNFNSVNIPAGVTVTFKRNAANTPVYLLSKTDIVVAGTIDVSGKNSPDTGTAGDGNLTDDGMPGHGGPGGFDGGEGGYFANPENGHSTRGGDGQGPGGGQGGPLVCNGGTGGGGGGYAGAGGTGNDFCGSRNHPQGGKSYGNIQLLPLMGGSGGGGSGGAPSYVRGIGGGGGSGAILLAASGTIDIAGKVQANGGSSGSNSPMAGISYTQTFGGGGGSGGAIRILASVFRGGGQIIAYGGGGFQNSGVGSVGRIRVEAESIFMTRASSPLSYNSSSPGLVFIPNPPSLSIASVGGITVLGSSDVTVPASTANPAAMVVNASGVPVGTLVSLAVKPDVGAAVNATPAALEGTPENSSVTLYADLPVGASVLEATTTFVIMAALGDRLAPYAGNERVEKITLTASTAGAAATRLTTVSGKVYMAPPGLWAAGG